MQSNSAMIEVKGLGIELVHQMRERLRHIPRLKDNQNTIQDEHAEEVDMINMQFDDAQDSG